MCIFIIFLYIYDLAFCTGEELFKVTSRFPIMSLLCLSYKSLTHLAACLIPGLHEKDDKSALGGSRQLETWQQGRSWHQQSIHTLALSSHYLPVAPKKVSSAISAMLLFVCFLPFFFPAGFITPAPVPDLKEAV